MSQFKCLMVLGILAALSVVPVAAFEGHIQAISSRGGPPRALLYTVATNFVRVEMTDTNGANAVDVLDRQSGMITLISPRNHTFIRFKPGMGNSSGRPPGMPSMPGGPPPGIGAQIQPGFRPGPPQMPNGLPGQPSPGGLPPGIGPTNSVGLPPRPVMPMPPQGLPPGIGPQAQSTMVPGAPAMPQMPVMPQPPSMGSMPAMPMMRLGSGLELKATGDTTNLLNYTCERYEIKQWGQTMEIWATDQLLPFQDYLPNQPTGVGPPSIERHWGERVAAKGLFPLLASLKFDNGMERYHFEVQSVTPARLTEAETKDFQTPPDYVEIPARPF